jgi:Tfp pilus assembly protein, ATPase PilM
MKLIKGMGDFFALDIGTSAIRAVQLTGSAKTGWTLQNYGYSSVDPSLVQNSSEEGRAKLGEVIMTVIGQSGIKVRDVAINFPANKTFTTIADVPNQSESELRKTIKYQLDQYIPMAVDDAKVDWALLGTSPRDMTKQEVLVASASMAYAEEQLEFIESLGLDVVAAEPDPIAMARSLTPIDINDARLIIDFGELSADMVIVYADAPRLVRSIPGGLQSITKAAAQNLNIRDEQARQFILKFGLAQDKLEGQVFRALDSNLENFASELVKSIKFFQTKYPNIAVGGIILSGFAGIIPFMSEYIEARTSTPTVKGNPWQKVVVPKMFQDKLINVASEFAVAVGLAERNNND